MDLNQVTLPANNMEASITFYKILGLNLIVHSHDAYARFELPEGSATFSLHVVAAGTPPSSALIYFEVEDVEGTVKSLEAKGIKFTTQPKEQSWLWREARFYDPFGNPLCIYNAGDNRKNPPWRLKGS